MSLKYYIEFSPLAQRQLKKMPKTLQQTLINKIEKLDPVVNSINIKKLKGVEELYRLRVGDYRIIYQVKHNKVLILVLGIGHLRDIYNNLSSYLRT